MARKATLRKSGPWARFVCFLPAIFLWVSGLHAGSACSAEIPSAKQTQKSPLLTVQSAELRAAKYTCYTRDGLNNIDVFTDALRFSLSLALGRGKKVEVWFGAYLRPQTVPDTTVPVNFALFHHPPEDKSHCLGVFRDNPIGHAARYAAITKRLSQGLRDTLRGGYADPRALFSARFSKAVLTLFRSITEELLRIGNTDSWLASSNVQAMLEEIRVQAEMTLNRNAAVVALQKYADLRRNTHVAQSIERAGEMLQSANELSLGYLESFLWSINKRTCPSFAYQVNEVCRLAANTGIFSQRDYQHICVAGGNPSLPVDKSELMHGANHFCGKITALQSTRSLVRKVTIQFKDALRVECAYSRRSEQEIKKVWAVPVAVEARRKTHVYWFLRFDSGVTGPSYGVQQQRPEGLFPCAEIPKKGLNPPPQTRIDRIRSIWVFDVLQANTQELPNHAPLLQERQGVGRLLLDFIERIPLLKVVVEEPSAVGNFALDREGWFADHNAMKSWEEALRAALELSARKIVWAQTIRNYMELQIGSSNSPTLESSVRALAKAASKSGLEIHEQVLFYLNVSGVCWKAVDRMMNVCETAYRKGWYEEDAFNRACGPGDDVLDSEQHLEGAHNDPNVKLKTAVHFLCDAYAAKENPFEKIQIDTEHGVREPTSSFEDVMARHEPNLGSNINRAQLIGGESDPRVMSCLANYYRSYDKCMGEGARNHLICRNGVNQALYLCLQ